MNVLEFTSLVWIGSCVAGLLGSLTGLGGGVVIVPLLTPAFGVDIRFAIGASLVSVIATSAGAAAFCHFDRREKAYPVQTVKISRSARNDR